MLDVAQYTDDESAAFLAARQATDRSSWRRFLEAEHVTKGDAGALKAALERWRATTPLYHPALRQLALRALQDARGRHVGPDEPFPATLWLGGAEDTKRGRRFLGNISQFVKLLQVRAREVAPKRTGWVIEPTTNPEGRRTNEKTLAIHALFLDCDGTGTWDKLLQALSGLGYCYVAYQSGGWSPSSPKWRVVLPLLAAHDTSTEAGIVAWKTAYNNARVVFGNIAELSCVGFDPATETPCCPWFLTEKRDAHDTERAITWTHQGGRALDLTALTLALPEVPEEKLEPTMRAAASELSLDEEQLNKIIDALTPVTNNIPTGRRDLYLALPGALLDRGVQPDDVIAIVEGVSLSYPRKHADKHADNMHNARTTISRWESKTQYTRIGTLNSIAPDAARVLDAVLPDPVQKAIGDSIEEMLRPSVTYTPQAANSSSVTISAATAASYPITIAPRRRPKLSSLGQKVSPIASRLKKTAKYRTSGLLLEALMNGVPLSTSTDTEAVNNAVAIAMTALGRHLPKDTTWAAVLEFASTSFALMDFSRSEDRVALAERAFFKGQGNRRKAQMKRETKKEADRQIHVAALRKLVL